MEPVIDKRMVYNQDNKIFFESHFKVEITPEQVVRNKAFLKSNILRINKDLSEMEFELAWKNELKVLDNDYRIKEEALKNYDKYVTDRVLEIKRDRDKNKLAIQQYINGFVEMKKAKKIKFKQQLEAQKNPLLRQLEHDTEQLEVYEKYEKNKSTKTEE